jgi:hypothetical protein
MGHRTRFECGPVTTFLATMIGHMRLLFTKRNRVQLVRDPVPNLPFIGVVMAVAAITTLASAATAQQLGWDYQPYHVRAVIAIDLPGGIYERFTSELPKYMSDRAEASKGPAWSLKVETAAGAARQELLLIMNTFQGEPAAYPLEGADKLVLIAIHTQAGEYTLTAREFDAYIQRWSPLIVRRTRQSELLEEQAFAILNQCIAPLAQVELDPQDDNRVILKPRGAALMQPRSGEPWTAPGDVFLPALRRTTRGGELLKGGIQQIPWTYLEVDRSDDAGTFAHVHSGTRRPFGARRQGRVEQIAIALRGDPANTTVRLHSRVADDKPLVGYEVLSQSTDKISSSLERIGYTDRKGNVIVSPGNDRVRVLFLKNGGQLLARLPIVPGDQPQLDVPLPDDDARLAAEARLAAMREELVDIVARRNILMARTRQKIEKKDFAAAQELVSQINELPGRSQFNLELQTAARRYRSDDPQIQRRIDRLFEGTQNALTQYLDVRPISELTNDLRAAQQKGT